MLVSAVTGDVGAGKSTLTAFWREAGASVIDADEIVLGERDLIAQFAHEQAHEIADLVYFEDLVRGVLRHAGELDAALAGHLDRTVEEVDPIERAALRIAAYELVHRPDVPYRVVINEAIDSTKRFGSEHGHTYVNGVLDKAAASLRSLEAQARR